eukprot:TRINITY_DN5339_c0_g1_i1.p1 TRINITY_DN5339_c0_g1~~TRINITY_DN5339_c0_g1_i1.p1  ORF type:complete len:180 (-),score=15.60 TRINITY_DN5339_c0_g1_i1:77-616(-)
MDLVHWTVDAGINLKEWSNGPEDTMIGTWLSILRLNRYNVPTCGFAFNSLFDICNSSTVVYLHNIKETSFKSCLEAEESGDICTCTVIEGSRFSRVSLSDLISGPEENIIESALKVETKPPIRKAQVIKYDPIIPQKIQSKKKETHGGSTSSFVVLILGLFIVWFIVLVFIICVYALQY